jgi:hypothetical protein
MCWCIRACSFVLDAQSRPALGRPPLWEGPSADHRTAPPRPPSLRFGRRPSPQKGRVKLSSSLALTSLHHRFSYARRQPSRRRNRQDQELDRHAGVRSIILVEPQLGENIGAGGSVAAPRAQQSDRVRWIGFPTSSSDSGSEIEALPPRAGEGFKNSAGRKGATFGPTIASAAATQHARSQVGERAGRAAIYL